MRKKYVSYFLFAFLLFPMFLIASELLIDDFNDGNAFANSLGQYTDDDGTLISDAQSGGVLNLKWNTTIGMYWYSVLGNLDASSYNYLSLVIKRSNHDENFEIQLKDGNSDKISVILDDFSPISTDTNGFEHFYFPLSYFPYISISDLDSLVFLFTEPFASLNNPANVKIDSIAFVSTNLSYYPVISPRLIADFENNSHHTKMGGYFVTEVGDTNISFAEHSWASVNTNENHTAYGHYSFRWHYYIAENDYSACYFTLSPDGYTADLSQYGYLSFYIKGSSAGLNYTFEIKDKNGNKGTALFVSSTEWEKVYFDIEVMAQQGNVDLSNLASIVFVSKQDDGITNSLYIDDLYLSIKSDGQSSDTKESTLIDFFKVNHSKILNDSDSVSISLKLKKLATVNISLYDADGQLIRNFISGNYTLDDTINIQFSDYAKINNGVYVFQADVKSVEKHERKNIPILIMR